MALALRVTTDLPSSLIFKTKKTSLLMCLNTRLTAAENEHRLMLDTSDIGT